MTVSIENLISQETLQKFKIYKRLLQEWNRRTGLVQENTLCDFYHRHILDSVQLVPLIECLPWVSMTQDASSFASLTLSKNQKLDVQSAIKNTVSIVDVGTGAGFPGMVLAMCGFKKVVLCESNQKKCFFLQEVSRQTNTDVMIINDRIENVREKFNIIVSRACMDLGGLLDIMSMLLSDASSCGFFHKGRTWQEEVAFAEKKWRFSREFSQSVTSKEGVILCIRHLERR